MEHSENHLIEQFPRDLQKRFLERCQRFELVPLAELGSRGHTLSHAYFPITGIIRLVVDSLGRPPLDVGAVGRESMLGSELLRGKVHSPWRAIVQTPGSCWRIEARALRYAMAEMPALEVSLQKNFLVQVLQRQAFASAAATPRHQARRNEPNQNSAHTRAAAA